MTLEAGTKLGPYEILSPLGAGGMGEVYRAKDTRLDREVAIKVLPSHLTSNTESKQRFEREAKAISSLTHPNICTLHDIGNEEGIDFLVMELLEGDTLSQRLNKGCLPLEDVLRFGVEIASALDKAHRAGIVHRDLKPGNIMLTKSGAKLLDFGLAKATPGQSGLSTAPDAVTITKPLTGKGTIVGTFQYMAPEQLEGKEADQRTDIFAFGAVLYEMATGKHAFSGNSRASLIASIMSVQPKSISELQPMTPPALDHLVRMCLVKDPDDRIQTAHDIKLQLQWIAEGGSLVGTPAPVVARRKIRERSWMVSSAVFLLAAIVSTMGYLRLNTVSTRIIRAELSAPKDTQFVFAGNGAGPAVLSPDGTMVTFVARDQEGDNRLWVRDLADKQARVLPETESAYFPFWSPDNRFIAFFADEKLKRIAPSGGFPVTICDARLGKGGSWSLDGTILLAPDYQMPIYKTQDSGGKPESVTKLDPNKHTTHRWPVFMPDGKHFIYFAGNHDLSKRGEDAIYFASLDGNTNHRLLSTDGNAIYASGYLLYLQDRTLMAQRFNPKAGLLESNPIPISGNIQYDPGIWGGVVSASTNNILIYQTADTSTGSGLTWFDRAGNKVGTVGGEEVFVGIPHLSPDGSRLAISIGDPGDVWVFELERDLRTRVTFEPVAEDAAIWSPDGKRIAFVSRNRPDRKNIICARSSFGLGRDELFLESDLAVRPVDWSPDGRFLLYSETDNIHLLDLENDYQTRGLLSTPFQERAPRFSPDGRWIAYSSNASGMHEVIVMPFSPDSETENIQKDRGGRWQISTSGGVLPVWRKDGKELYYQAPDKTIMALEVDGDGDAFRFKAAKPLFRPSPTATGYLFDVSNDGQRFIVKTLDESSTPPIKLILNWTQTLANK